MPRIQREQRRKDVQSICRRKGKHDIPEDLVSKHVTDSDAACFLDVLDTGNGEVDCTYDQLGIQAYTEYTEKGD